MLPAEIDPPLRTTLAPPATAVAVPPQVFDNPVGFAATNRAGNPSLNWTPVTPTEFGAGFVSVKVSDVTPFRGILFEPKAIAIEGGATTAIEADAVPPMPPSFEPMVLVVSFFCPAVVPVTFIEIVHDAP